VGAREARETNDDDADDACVRDGAVRDECAVGDGEGAPGGDGEGAHWCDDDVDGIGRIDDDARGDDDDDDG